MLNISTLLFFHIVWIFTASCVQLQWINGKTLSWRKWKLEATERRENSLSLKKTMMTAWAFSRNTIPAVQLFIGTRYFEISFNTWMGILDYKLGIYRDIHGWYFDIGCNHVLCNLINPTFLFSKTKWGTFYQKVCKIC